jgi:glycogen operon protein
VNERGLADISWHGCRTFAPGWDDPGSRVLAFTLGGFPIKSSVKTSDADTDIHVMMNMDWADLDFDVPAVEGRRWYRVIDTGAASPADIFEPGTEPLFEGDTCRVANRSIVVLISKP